MKNNFYNLLYICEYIENHIQYNKIILDKTPWGSYIFNVILDHCKIIFTYDEKASEDHNMYYHFIYQNKEFSFLGNLYNTFLDFTINQLPKTK